VKAAIYCRVSTDDQEKEGTSLQTQREACLAYCKQKDYEVVRQFSETYSGLTLERPRLNELRDLIRASGFDVIVVYCLDRLSRNATHGVILRDELDNNYVTLESVTEDIDKSPLGEAITYLRGTFAQIETEKIRERTIRGKLARLKEGKLPQGTGIGIFGYSWDKTIGKRQIIDSEAETVLKIFGMAINGISTNKIAITLNESGIKTKSGSLWYPFTVRNILNNETYTGKTYFGKTKRVSKTRVEAQPKENWTLLPDVTPPIIDEETFKRTQEAIAKAKKSRPIKPNSPYLLTGFMKCSKCGSTIGGTTLSGKYRYYKCRGASPTATRDKICDAGYIKANQLESDVWEKVIDMASNPLSLLSLIIDNNRIPHNNDVRPILDKQISKLRKKLKTYKTKEKNLINLLSHDNVTQEYVLESINNLKQERTSDEKQLEGLLESRKQAFDNEPITLKLSEMSAQFRNEAVQVGNSNDLTLKRNILEHLQLQVTADPKTHQFSFRFYGLLVSSSQKPIQDFINENYYEFEKQHPEFSLDDIVNPDVILPEDTKFAQILNPVKKNLRKEKQDLVTIE